MNSTDDKLDGRGFWTDILFISLVAASVFFTNLGAAKLWDRDEPRNAGCAIEMMQRGDWVTPMFNDELRGQKPVLTYWLIMSAIAVFGEGEFAARFWSAMLGVGTVLLTYLWVRHLFFAQLARWAALILSTTLMFAVASRAATPDAPLIFFSTLALTLYVVTTFLPSNATDWDQLFRCELAGRLRVPGRWFPRSLGAMAVYAAMAFGVLAKGPVAVVLPSIIIGLFILIESSRAKRVGSVSQDLLPKSRVRAAFSRLWAVINPKHFARAVWQMQPWWLLLAVALIAMPWFVWVGVRTEGEFLRQFFFREHFERATTAMEGHSGGLWFYPVAIVAGVFPWSIVIVPAMILLWRFKTLVEEKPEMHWPGGLTLAMVWTALQVGVLSLANTKLPSYVTPCYPAVAVLLALVPVELECQRWRMRAIWIRAGFATWCIVGVAISLALYYLTAVYLAWPVGWLPALGAVLVLGGIAAWIAWEKGQQISAARVALAGSWAFIVLAFGFVTTDISGQRTTDDLWEVARVQQDPPGVLASYRDLESTWVYYAGRPIWETVPGGLHPTSARSLERKNFWDAKPKVAVANLLQVHPGSCIVTPEKHLEELLSQVPSNYAPVARRPDFLTNQTLVLVGPTSASDAAAYGGAAESARSAKSAPVERPH